MAKELDLNPNNLSIKKQKNVKKLVGKKAKVSGTLMCPMTSYYYNPGAIMVNRIKKK